MMERSNMKVKNKLVYWGAVIVLGVFTVRLGRNVWKLWKAGERIKQAELEVRSQELENQELQKRLAEVQSPEFIEKEAREKLGLGKEGETIVVMPDNADLKSQISNLNGEPNWRKWWKVYVSD
ncbi:MAG: hypothetical protein UX80_C0028G0011 [Candidatus Amesbacteria bacterium GW2011_GWA2_47_11b]|nr:MAG: hypothetical protein UX80_C0028G0011 [Candidatus Amesbacteria bacterium GW2011_GWA2_47_11b]KKU83293.1 MAG: hypothetical protein UY11_C0023G0011 [Candidatus Amesbacteria bacterium GW2011_GWC2_47_8]